MWVHGSRTSVRPASGGSGSNFAPTLLSDRVPVTFGGPTPEFVFTAGGQGAVGRVFGDDDLRGPALKSVEVVDRLVGDAAEALVVTHGPLELGGPVSKLACFALSAFVT